MVLDNQVLLERMRQIKELAIPRNMQMAENLDPHAAFALGQIAALAADACDRLSHQVENTPEP